jgi:porphobilinogen deaminase
LRERCGAPVGLVTVATPGDESAAPIERLATTGVFTSTLRALLRAAGRPLQIVPMRGNVGTRLRKLADGEVDALFLAMAGLSRLGLLDAVATPLDPSLLMPAPAQGALAVECRTDDPVTVAHLMTLDHAPTRAAVVTERSFLAALDVGCSAPVGALAELTGEAGAEPAVRLSGLIAAPDGSSVRRARLPVTSIMSGRSVLATSPSPFARKSRTTCVVAASRNSLSSANRGDKWALAAMTAGPYARNR